MILDKYLIKEFMKVFLFSTLSFVALLFTTRLQEIAQLASLGAPVGTVLLFCLYQVPYILPIVIPVSALISGILLARHLSTSQELTILRSSGLSLRRILSPLILVSCAIALFNFFIVSEVATSSHAASRQLQEELKRINPLVLLNHRKQSNIQGVYVNALGGAERGHEAQDVIIALWNKKTESIALISTKKIRANIPYLETEHLSFILPITTIAEEPNSLMIENIASSKTTMENFSSMIKNRSWRIHADYLSIGMLFVALRENAEILKETPDDNTALRFSYELMNEISRRVSIAFAAITFTFLGAAYGMQVGRHSGSKGTYVVIFLATLYLVCYFIGKNMEQKQYISTFFFLIPHLLIIGASLFSVRRLSRGIEAW